MTGAPVGAEGGEPVSAPVAVDVVAIQGAIRLADVRRRTSEVADAIARALGRKARLVGGAGRGRRGVHAAP